MITLLRKQRYFIDYTLGTMMRHKGKSLGLLSVYTMIIFMLASVMLFSHAMRSEAVALLADSPEIVVQRIQAGRSVMVPADYLQRIGKLRGVTEKRGRLWGYYYDPAVKANYTVMASEQDQLTINDIVIGEGIGRTRGLSVGDYLTLRSHEGKAFSFRVSRLLESESELISSDLLLMNPQGYRQLFGIDESLYTDLVLSVRNPREIQKIAEKLTRLLPDSRPILRSEILRTYESLFSWRQGVMLILLLGSVLAFVIFAWDKASGLSAEERKEIGILKAVGWETGEVMRMKFWEGVIISLMAFLIGYLAAYLHVFYTSAGLFEPVLKGWSVLYPSFQLTPSVDGLQLATLFFFTVLPYTLATIVPVWRTSITDPDLVMR
ncbi:MAG: FtsX-like permease family protein [Candidatus Thiodiazotropha taylori]|nr:FtsX-like permease family protein [Candidatus Thiodiazotropha taylori]RLW63200.1 MAG: ABC transporter permease [gamma proteobacterium symbiont of Stewartia floridana]MCG7894870.1 FtsX-like permease family protein [Candidatus Thiodiazotropha taylori]MCG7912132.1 FtsX-like permease family protein [Candidatus Thiodiazotropha taylori]MCG7918346.1 FtsX-like permease family protein [Candidatus Thiodiazotropha taylori]